MVYSSTLFRRVGLNLVFALFLILVSSLSARAAWEYMHLAWDKTTPGGVVAYSPVAPLIATAQGFGTIKFYTPEGTLQQTLVTGQSVSTGLAFSSDGQLLASCSDESVKIWSVRDVTCLMTITDKNIFSMALSPDGKTLVTGGWNAVIKLWRVSDGACLCSLTGHTGAIYSLAFSPDGQTVASASDDHLTKVWRVSDGVCLQTLTGHTDTVSSISFTPDGHTLVTGSWDKTIKFWRVSDGALLQTLTGHTGQVRCLAISPDGQKLVSGSADTTINIWQMSSGFCLKTISMQLNVTSLAFSSNSQSFTSGIFNDSVIRLWSASDGTCLRTITGDTAAVQCVVYSPDGQTLAACAEDTVQDTVRLYRAYDGMLLNTFSFTTFSFTVSAAFSPDGQVLAACGYNLINLWRVTDGVCLRTINGQFGQCTSIAYSPDGQLLAVGNTVGNITLYRTSDGTPIRACSGHTRSITSVTFSPDGKMLASGSRDSTIRLWRVSDGVCLQTLSGLANSVAFAPDGNTLAVGCDDCSLKLWQISTGSWLQTFTGHTGQVWSVSYAPDGQTLASGSFDDSIKLWRVSDGTCMATLNKHTAYGVTSVAFAPDGQQVACGGEDGVGVWSNLGYQPDLLICNAGATSYLGGGVYDDLTQQTASQSVVAGVSAKYLINIRNVGTAQDTLTMSLPAGGNGWTVQVFDGAAGTTPMNAWSWLLTLDANSGHVYRVEITPSAGVSNNSSFTEVVYAVSDADSIKTDAVCMSTTKLPALSAVTLSALPAAPASAQTPITLTATPTGSGVVEYRFRAGYTDAAGWHWSDLTGYTTTAACKWTPTLPASYTLVVWARTAGHTANYDVYAAIPYQVTAAKLSAVALTVAPPAPQPVNTTINLSASPTGGGTVEYKFRAGYTDAAGWHWSDLTGYITNGTCSWTPGVATNYTLVVWARTVGHAASYDVYNALTYQVTAPKLTAVALGVTPAAPQAAKTPVTLTATPTGGGSIEYKFRAGYTDAAGWHWSDLTGYTTTPTCKWTPTLPASYTLVVWARMVGHTASYDVYKAVSYQVTAPALSAVSLSVTPAAPQPVKTVITLTAVPTGGSIVEYKFRAGYTDAAGWHWSDLTGYTTTTTCTWTPALATTYTLVVWARTVGHTASYDAYKAITYQTK